jgi:hypothetical protein
MMRLIIFIAIWFSGSICGSILLAAAVDSFVVPEPVFAIWIAIG